MRVKQEYGRILLFVINRDDKTGTNIRIHCQCQTPILFQKHGLHQ